MTNNRTRSNQLNALAAEIAARENISPLDPPVDNLPYIAEIMKRSNCHRETARHVWARYLRRALHPHNPAAWGGTRKNAGRKKDNMNAINANLKVAFARTTATAYVQQFLSNRPVMGSLWITYNTTTRTFAAQSSLTPLADDDHVVATPTEGSYGDVGYSPRAARAALIAYLSSEDYWTPDRVAAFHEALND